MDFADAVESSESAGDEDTGSSNDDDDPEATGSPGGDADGEDTGGVGERDGCDLLDCDPGMCASDENGLAVCVCPDDHASVGHGCMPCHPFAGGLDLDLGLIDVTGRITINGDAPPKNLYEYGDLYLRNPATGDEVLLGSTYEGQYTATALPGTYDIVFVNRAGGDAVPSNARGFIVQRVIDNHAPIDIDIRTTTVAGSIRFGEALPPQNLYDYGRVYLRNEATGDEVTLAHTHEREFVANVLPGTYTLHYGVAAAQTIAPRNVDTNLRVVEIPDASEIVIDLDVVIPVVQVQGVITLGGAAPPANLYETGRIAFVDRTTGARFEVGQTHEGSYSAVVVPGAYDVFYERVAGGTVVPRNERARLFDRLDIDASQTLDLDIPVATLSGTVTVGGQPPPASTSDDGVLRLHHVETGDVVVLGHTRHGSFSRLVVPGKYEVHYAQATAGAVMPGNLDAFVTDLEVTATGADVDIDISVVDVSGTITIDGATPPTSEYSDGRLYLRDPRSGDSVLLGNTRLASFASRVVPGEYDIVYVVETTGDGVPLNGAAHLGSVDVMQTPSFTVDVPLTRLAGNVRVAGQLPPADAADHGVLFLQDVASADRIFLADTRAGTYSTRVTAGQYLVGYRVTKSTGLVPQNTDALFECIAVE